MYIITRIWSSWKQLLHKRWLLKNNALQSLAAIMSHIGLVQHEWEMVCFGSSWNLEIWWNSSHPMLSWISIKQRHSGKYQEFEMIPLLTKLKTYWCHKHFVSKLLFYYSLQDNYNTTTGVNTQTLTCNFHGAWSHSIIPCEPLQCVEVKISK